MPSLTPAAMCSPACARRFLPASWTGTSSNLPFRAFMRRLGMKCAERRITRCGPSSMPPALFCIPILDGHRYLQRHWSTSAKRRVRILTWNSIWTPESAGSGTFTLTGCFARCCPRRAPSCARADGRERPSLHKPFPLPAALLMNLEGRASPPVQASGAHQPSPRLSSAAATGSPLEF